MFRYIKDEKKNTTNYKTINGVTFITFPLFEEQGLIHGMTTRIGGVSKDHLGSMNVSFSRGDDEANVLENHKRLAKAIGYPYEKLVFSNQVHDTVIKEVFSEDAGKGIVRPSDIIGVDGIMTKEKQLPLMTFYADCVPLFFYDPTNEVIAMAHSGWKGTVAFIGQIMVNKLITTYGTKPEELLCAIGPSICQSCYEVSQDVVDAFYKSFKDKTNNFIIDDHNGKYHLDLHEACYQTLIGAGVLPEHINKTDICTCCNSEVLFSHRASHGMRGNLGAVMMLS